MTQDIIHADCKKSLEELLHDSLQEGIGILTFDRNKEKAEEERRLKMSNFKKSKENFWKQQRFL